MKLSTYSPDEYCEIVSGLPRQEQPLTHALIVLGSGFEESQGNAEASAGIATLSDGLLDVVLSGGSEIQDGAGDTITEAEVMRRKFMDTADLTGLGPDVKEPILDRASRNTYMNMMNGLALLNGKPSVIGVIGRSAHAWRAAGIGRMILPHMDDSLGFPDIVPVAAAPSTDLEVMHNVSQYSILRALASRARSLEDTDRAHATYEDLVKHIKNRSRRYRANIPE